MVYVTSMSDYRNDTGVQWGNARIDKFSYEQSSLTHEGLAFLAQGTFRLSVPSFDAVTSELSINVINQGSAGVTIDTLTVAALTAGSTSSTTCTDNLLLAAGAQCSITITAGAGVRATGSILIATIAGNYDSSIEYLPGDDTYEAFGLNQDFGEAGLPVCAVDNFGSYRQQGSCALTAITLSSDGTSAYVNEDDNDIAVVFAIDPVTDNLTFVSEGASVGLQGIAVNADNTYVYNGNNAYSVLLGELTQENPGSGGNATEVVTDGAGATLLLSTIGNDNLSIYELDTDPELPTEIDVLNPSSGGGARFQHHSADLSMFTVVGFGPGSNAGGPGAVTTVGFDGADLVELDSVDTEITLPLAVCDPAALPAGADDCLLKRLDRNVQMTPDGLFAVSAWFLNLNDDDAALAGYQSGATAYSIAPVVGDLAQTAEMTFDGVVRAILLVPTP